MSSSPSPAWRNRIVGAGAVPPEQLLAHPFNWRVHSRLQQDQMEAALRDIGWIDDVIVNQVTGHIINGHMRVGLALRQGEPEVPVKYVELSQDEELRALLTFDPLGAAATADRDMLGAALQDVTTNEIPLMELMTALAQQERIVPSDTALPDLPATRSASTPLQPDTEPTMVDTEPEPVQEMRQIGLLFTPDEHAEFLALGQALMRHFNTETLANTAIETYRWACTELALEVVYAEVGD